jgi:hypothetical protein
MCNFYGAAGSGCSAWVAKPSWRTDPNCPGRTTADVAADADPNTGPAVYDTADGRGGWILVGGTSAAFPFIAGAIALQIYALTADLNDVTSGSDVFLEICGGDYLCSGEPGYDGPPATAPRTGSTPSQHAQPSRPRPVSGRVARPTTGIAVPHRWRGKW